MMFILVTVFHILLINIRILNLQSPPPLNENQENSAQSTLSTCNNLLSSNNFSEELANLTALTTNPSDNINQSSSAIMHQITTQSDFDSNVTSLGDSQNSEIVVDISAPSTHESQPAPLSIDSDYHGIENQFTEQLTDEQNFNDCSAILQNDILPQPTSSAASSTSKGDFSPSTNSNVLESAVFSSSYLYTLLNNLEHEIDITQQHLDDENDKRHKYKVRFIQLQSSTIVLNRKLLF